MTKESITYLLWSDTVGVTRTRGIPTVDLDGKRATGLGWASAGQALTAFGSIVANPWGPMDEARQIPDLSTAFSYKSAVTGSEWSAVICDSRLSPEQDWDCCARTFYKRALAALHQETGLTLAASFEHEFLLTSDRAPRTGFSLAAALQNNDFLQACSAALRHAGVIAESLEPEHGPGQYEISCAPKIGVAAADAALIAREVIRAVANDFGMQLSFSPKPAADAIGNGAHIHFSLVNDEQVNVTHDPAAPLGLSQVARDFSAGILKHLDALTAISAPTPVSYYRIRPNAWSCGFKTIGIQNREAALRVTPSVSLDPAHRAAGYNIEYRPADATASPYLTLGALVWAGLDGIRNKTALPTPIDFDPSTLTLEQLRDRGISALPASLDDALNALEADQVARTWFAPTFYEVYRNLKRWELEQANSQDEATLLNRYAQVY